jgi:hypothetical protein
MEIECFIGKGFGEKRYSKIRRQNSKATKQQIPGIYIFKFAHKKNRQLQLPVFYFYKIKIYFD